MVIHGDNSVADFGAPKMDFSVCSLLIPRSKGIAIQSYMQSVIYLEIWATWTLGKSLPYREVQKQLEFVVGFRETFYKSRLSIGLRKTFMGSVWLVQFLRPVSIALLFFKKMFWQKSSFLCCLVSFLNIYTNCLSNLKTFGYVSWSCLMKKYCSHYVHKRSRTFVGMIATSAPAPMVAPSTPAPTAATPPVHVASKSKIGLAHSLQLRTFPAWTLPTWILLSAAWTLPTWLLLTSTWTIKGHFKGPSPGEDEFSHGGSRCFPWLWCSPVCEWGSILPEGVGIKGFYMLHTFWQEIFGYQPTPTVRRCRGQQ